MCQQVEPNYPKQIKPKTENLVHSSCKLTLRAYCMIALVLANY